VCRVCRRGRLRLVATFRRGRGPPG
jgi:hypothetical protein